jgi:hypothetical protein
LWIFFGGAVDYASGMKSIADEYVVPSARDYRYQIGGGSDLFAGQCDTFCIA